MIDLTHIRSIGEEYGEQVGGILSSLRIKCATVVSVDEENAYVQIFADTTPLPVPLSFLNSGDADRRIVPTVGSMLALGMLNGDDNRPIILACEQINRFEFRRNKIAIHASVDPDDETKDEVTVTVGNSSLRIAQDVIEFNGAQNKGLVLYEPLRESLLKINQFLEAMNSVISGSPIAEAGNGSPSAFQTALRSALSGRSLDQYDNIANEKILQ